MWSVAQLWGSPLLHRLVVWMSRAVDGLVGRTDAELVQIAKRQGDRGKGAFDLLVQRHSHMLFTQLYRLLGDRGLAEDVTQETFVKAYLELPKLREEAAFPGWLRRIGTRTAFNLRRSRQTRDHYEADAERERGEGADNPEAYTGAAEVVWKVLGELSYPYREVLVLRYLEELSVEEIAAHLRLGKSAAKMRLKRARDEFKRRHLRMV